MVQTGSSYSNVPLLVSRPSSIDDGETWYGLLLNMIVVHVHEYGHGFLLFTFHVVTIKDVTVGSEAEAPDAIVFRCLPIRTAQAIQIRSLARRVGTTHRIFL